jgi:hypothetical protein
MHALVVYESMFGNTEAIARAVAEGLATRLEVETVEVGAAPGTLEEGMDLLVVGGPTHAFGMTRPSTRQDAERKAGHVISAQIGLREWLAGVRTAGPPAAATFDTRIAKPRVPGSAARAAEKRLRRLGYRMAAPAESFFVTDVDGPLVEGEAERAKQWGADLGAALAGANVAEVS